MLLVTRYFDHNRGSFFLFGPRGTGKSTWLRQKYPEAAWIDLLDSGIHREYLARPERLKDFVAANRKNGIIIIDEIQRVPELLSMVHREMELDKSIQFILTGSSARKIRQAGVDLLAGRAVVRNMHPFMAGEMGAFNLPEALHLGMLPLVRMSADPEQTLRSYAGLYLEQEVKAEGLVRRLDGFSRFLEAASFSHAEVLNTAAIARECGISRTSVESFLSILEDLLLAVRIPVFARRAKRALVSHAKFFLFDAGVFRSLRPAGPLDVATEIEGPALEGLVLQHLRAWIEYRDLNARIHFWRTLAGNEVDFVVYGDGEFTAIEVKNTRNLQPRDLRGLRSFREDYPEARTLLLYRGQEALETDGIQCLPVDKYLAGLGLN